MDADARARQAWIVWAAMANSQLVIGAVGAWLAMSRAAEPPPDAVPVWLLVAVAALTGASSLVIGQLLRSADFFTVSLIRWALAESTTLVGFVIGFLTGRVGVLAGLVGYALCLLAVAAPTPSARQRWEERGR